MHTDQSYLAVFRSRQQATAFWMNLQSAGVESTMISSPAPLSRGCGVSVRFEPCDYDRVRQVSGFRKMSAFDGFFFYDPKLRRYFRI